MWLKGNCNVMYLLRNLNVVQVTQKSIEVKNYVVQDKLREKINVFVRKLKCYICFFDVILYTQSTICQLYRGGSSWVDPVLS